MSGEYSRIEQQTDKDETKIVPCTYPDCDVGLEVTKFYAPSKARCSSHQGQTSTNIRKAVDMVGSDEERERAEPNRTLGDLRCPLCDKPLQVRRIRERVGTVTFVCRSRDGGCNLVAEITPDWAPLMMDAVPEELAPFVAIFNARQQLGGITETMAEDALARLEETLPRMSEKEVLTLRTQYKREGLSQMLEVVEADLDRRTKEEEEDAE